MDKKRLNTQFLNEFKNYDFSKIKEDKVFLVGSITKAGDLFPKIESILQIIHKKLVSICSIDGFLHKKKFSKEEWDKLQNVALRKLKTQEALLVLDIDNYIGIQSSEEIKYAREEVKIPIYYLSKLKRRK